MIADLGKVYHTVIVEVIFAGSLGSFQVLLFKLCLVSRFLTKTTY